MLPACVRGCTRIPRSTVLRCTVLRSTAHSQQRALWFLGFNHKLRQLEADANSNPTNPAIQAAFLNELNKKDSSAVIRRYQSQRFASDENCLREYIAALAHTGALDRMSLAQISQFVKSTSPKTLEASSTSPENLRTIMTDNIHVALTAPQSTGTLAWRLIRGVGVISVLIGGAIATIGATTQEDESKPFSKSSTVHKEYTPQMSNKTFDDVQGMDESKEDLEDLVRFLKDPKHFTRLGGKLPRGYLLVGPPGTGKTLLAKAVAGEAGVSFLFASGSDFDEMYVGLGARRIRSLFAAAKQRAPCIVFVDEIDAVGSARSPLDQSHARMSLNQLLVEMDGFDQSSGVIVIGATNFPELLDPALVRPGRFDQTVTVPLPDVKGREDILKHYFKKVPIGPDVDVTRIARALPGASGADIENIVNTAALRAAHLKREHVTLGDLDYAQDKVFMGPERKSMVLSKEEQTRTAYHEGGHALVAALTEGAHQIRKATIVPRGGALGMVSYLEPDDQGSMSRRQMLARIDVALAGRAAEELIFGHDQVTSGASSDLRAATRVARAMVVRFGMSPDSVGFATTKIDDSRRGGEDDDEGNVSGAKRRDKVDEEVTRILVDGMDRARAVLKNNEQMLHTLAQALLERETLSESEIVDLLGLKRKI